MMNIEDRIRQGLHAEAEAAPAPKTIEVKRRRRRVLVPTLAGVAALVVIAVASVAVLATGGPSADAGWSKSVTPTTAVVVDAVPVWPPAPSPVTPPTGATWVCPSGETGTDTYVPADAIPDEVQYVPAMPIEALSARAYGEACHRNPALVAMSFSDSERTSADVAIVVWVEAPSAGLNEPPMRPLRSEPSDPAVCYEVVLTGDLECFETEPSGTALADLSTLLSSELRPTTRTPDEVWTLTEQNGFTVRERNDRVDGNERIEMVGVIDGLPVWIEASGIGVSELQSMAGNMTADAVGGQVKLDEPTQGVEVVLSAPVIAETVEKVVLHWDADGFDGEVWLQPDYVPYTLTAFSVDWFGFATVGDTTAVFAREGGGTGALTWQVAPGVVAHLGSDASLDRMLSVAGSFTNQS